MFQQMAHMIIPEHRAHGSEFFVLNYAQNATLWKWKNTITRQNLFEDQKNLAFLKAHDYLKNFVYATPEQIRDYPHLREIDEAPARCDEKVLVGNTSGGYIINIDAAKMRNRNLSSVLEMCDDFCLEKNQLCARNGEEFFIPRPYRPIINLVVENEAQQQPEIVTMESSSDDASDESEPLTFNGYDLAAIR